MKQKTVSEGTSTSSHQVEIPPSPIVAVSYELVWESTGARHYKVKAKWAESLWQARKLTHETYEDYLFKTRDGVLGRKRTLDVCRERKKLLAEREEMQAVIQRIRSNAELFRPYPVVPEAVEWLADFKKDARQCKYANKCTQHIPLLYDCISG